jgi:hypothetical protein
MQRLFDGVAVENPLVKGAGINGCRQIAIFIGKSVLILFLFLRRKFFVGYPLVMNFSSVSIDTKSTK